MSIFHSHVSLPEGINPQKSSLVGDDTLSRYSQWCSHEKTVGRLSWGGHPMISEYPQMASVVPFLLVESLFIAGWWFVFVFFHILAYTGNNNPNWLSFFHNGRSTTNQICVDLPIWTFTWMQISPHNSLLIMCLVGFEYSWLKLVFVSVNLLHMPLCFELYWQQLVMID